MRPVPTTMAHRLAPYTATRRAARRARPRLPTTGPGSSGQAAPTTREKGRGRGLATSVVRDPS